MWRFDVVNRAWDGIDAGIYPMVPGGWKCSPKYCEYYPICRGRYA
jgi:hypothetical protein